MPIDPHDVHRVVHAYLLENGWQRHEADSLYHRPWPVSVDPNQEAVGSLGTALTTQLEAAGINLALNPQVVVYPPPIELLAGDPRAADDVLPGVTTIYPNDPPAHQPGPTATYPDGSPLADPPPPAAD